MIAWLLACAGAAGPERPPFAPPTTPAVEAPVVRPPPPYFVDLRAIDGLRLSIRYATPDNFTGAPLPGYEQPGAWMTPRSAAALGRVQAALQTEGLGLLVYDAYRPMRATDAMVEWTEKTHQQHLIRDGYIASRSGHNKGNTVDLTLVDAQGTPLDMGTEWDTFSTDSHTDNATGTALVNRHRLRDRMVAEGFRPYSKEWWHFSWPERVPHRDEPYAPEE